MLREEITPTLSLHIDRGAPSPCISRGSLLPPPTMYREGAICRGVEVLELSRGSELLYIQGEESPY